MATSHLIVFSIFTNCSPVLVVTKVRGLDEVTLDSCICTSSSPNGSNAPIVGLHVAVANDEDQPKDATTIAMTKLDAGELVQQFFHSLIISRL